jgi:hypothetical protein
LRILITKAQSGVGDRASDGVRLFGVKGGIVTTTVCVLSEEVAKGVVEVLGVLDLGMGDELLRLGRLRAGVVTGQDSGAADRAEHKSGGGGGELHSVDSLRIEVCERCFGGEEVDDTGGY